MSPGCRYCSINHEKCYVLIGQEHKWWSRQWPSAFYRSEHSPLSEGKQSLQIPKGRLQFSINEELIASSKLLEAPFTDRMLYIFISLFISLLPDDRKYCLTQFTKHVQIVVLTSNNNHFTVSHCFFFQRWIGYEFAVDIIIYKRLAFRNNSPFNLTESCWNWCWNHVQRRQLG